MTGVSEHNSAEHSPKAETPVYGMGIKEAICSEERKLFNYRIYTVLL